MEGGEDIVKENMVKLTNGAQETGRAALTTKPVVVVTREGFEAVIAERDRLSTASESQRVRMLLGLFTIALTAALLGFVGGFSVGQHTNDESFKAACSRVVDETMKTVKCPNGNAIRSESPSLDSAIQARP
jgi:hypothetical protein